MDDPMTGAGKSMDSILVAQLLGSRGTRATSAQNSWRSMTTLSSATDTADEGNGW
jgi:hypothetical protein